VGGYKSEWAACKCRVERIYPYPSAEELSSYYNDSYLSKKSHAKRFSKGYRATVFKEYSYSLADLGLANKDLVRMRILDFGCADGIFLDYLRSIGAKKEKLFGIDISREMAAAAAKKGYTVTTADESGKLRGRFDLITLWDVLEHLTSPVETLKGLECFLKHGSKVLVQTPRIGLLSDMFREKFEHYLPLEHIHLFTREALLKLFESRGFRTIAVSSFGANAPAEKVPAPYKEIFDRLAKRCDEGATQLALFQWQRKRK
jgi:2-polyprenyl-3-methyl-5-hydroxy-6-metoxy-1,4-benzoquinol methylase